MIIGYARVSTEDQKLDLQTSALKNVNCDQIFADQGISGHEFSRPGLDKALRRLKSGDTLVVWRLDRLGRSLLHLVEMMERLEKRKIAFISITEKIDTSSSGGKLIFHVLAALSEFERSLISERTRAGMAAARQNGKRLGRPPQLSASDIRDAARAVGESKEPLGLVAKRYKVTERTLKRALKAASPIRAA